MQDGALSRGGIDDFGKAQKRLEDDADDCDGNKSVHKLNWSINTGNGERILPNNESSAGRETCSVRRMHLPKVQTIHVRGEICAGNGQLAKVVRPRKEQLASVVLFPVAEIKGRKHADDQAEHELCLECDS